MKHKGELLWICRKDFEVIKISKIFNIDGLEQIRHRIASFEFMKSHPKQFSTKDRRAASFYKIPYNKIAWG